MCRRVCLPAYKQLPLLRRHPSKMALGSLRWRQGIFFSSRARGKRRGMLHSCECGASLHFETVGAQGYQFWHSPALQQFLVNMPHKVDTEKCANQQRHLCVFFHPGKPFLLAEGALEGWKQSDASGPLNGIYTYMWKSLYSLNQSGQLISSFQILVRNVFCCSFLN